ncbi:MAG: aminotransferase class V-fold PLP-dependent enzyme [Ardenticatenaceae bacterium]|nr:aminotransferase class V-fold PLP-dependent enzyme [Ardenticatenaceae bacterium]
MTLYAHHTSGDHLREQFLLRPDVIFLNHGSFGACPRPVFEVYQRWQLELQRQPVEFLGRRFNELMRAAREPLAAFVGADPDDLVYVPNATTGLNVVARSLPLRPGDEVLSTDHEYGALDRTWRFICRRRGAHYINHPLPVPLESQEQVVEALWSRVTARTRVLFLSHITSPTALILPVAELVRRAREAGILTVIDGAHAPGQVPLDLTALGADFYAGNLHKWVCAPPGSAFLYARREVQPLLEPLVVSWGWQSETPGSSRFIDEQEWQGTRDIAAFLAVPAALEFLATHDWPRVQRECHELARTARRQISALTGLEPLTPDSPDWYAQMVALPLPPCHGEVLKQRLYDEFAVEVPILSWNGRQLVRVSIQGYTTPGDVDALVTGLAALLPEGRGAGLG